MQFSFVDPKYLLLLFLIPVVVAVHFFAIRMTKRNAIKFSNFDSIARIKGVDIFSKNIVVLLASIFIILSLILALSGFTVIVNLNSSQFSYIIAIDSSESMLANDMLPTRIEFSKENAVSFVEKLPLGSKVGVISFSGNAIVETKVTDNKEQIINALKNIEVTDIGGTDISEALVTSTNLLNDEKYKSIILLSDGQINTGAIDKAIDYAARNNVVIHTIGIGTKTGGETSYGISKLDEDSLKGISYNTGGSYINLQNDGGLSNAFDEIVKFEKVNVEINLSKYLLIFSLILFLIEFILINTRYRTYP